MKRIGDVELIGIFSDPRNVRDQRLVKEQESSEALWRPLTRRNFELFSLSGCVGRSDVSSWRGIEPGHASLLANEAL
jgi:hypothetical protein